MSKSEFNKFIGVIILLATLTIFKRWFNFSFALVWLGVIVGFYLPFIDHLFYAYIIRPNLEVSKNIRSLVSYKKIKQLVSYVHETEDQREKLIVHTAYFQMVFLFLTFYVLSSSSGLFGRGLVFGFSLKLFVEQFLQYVKTKEIDKWFLELPVSMDLHKTKAYLYANGLILLIFILML
jgi:hypothetical protein